MSGSRIEHERLAHADRAPRRHAGDMIKALFVGRRAAGISRAACHAHLRDVHGPMVVCAPPGAGPLPCDYVQNHVFDGAYPASGGHAIERDLATELWFDDVDTMQASGSTPYYLANLKPDEPRFVDDATVAKMRLEPRTIRDGARGRYKLFVLAARAAGSGDAVWMTACAAAAAWLAGAAGVTALVENVVAPPPVGERFVDVVLEAWLDDRATAATHLSRADRWLAPFGDAIDRRRSFVLAAEEWPAALLRALHLGMPG